MKLHCQRRQVTAVRNEPLLSWAIRSCDFWSPAEIEEEHLGGDFSDHLDPQRLPRFYVKRRDTSVARPWSKPLMVDLIFGAERRR